MISCRHFQDFLTAHVLLEGQRGPRLELSVDYIDRRRHLPRITVRRAA